MIQQSMLFIEWHSYSEKQKARQNHLIKLFFVRVILVLSVVYLSFCGFSIHFIGDLPEGLASGDSGIIV